MALEKHALKGIHTLPSLRDAFTALATYLVTVDKNTPEPGWLDLALQQISNLVKFRRTDGSGNLESTENIVAQTEKYLALGDLNSAVVSLDKLSGPSKIAAASWLASAKARQGAEQVLASLHAHALSLLSTTEG